MSFRREKQNVSASELLQALADGVDIQLSQCTVTGFLDVNRLFDPSEKFQTDKLLPKVEPTHRTLTFGQLIVFDKCVFEENVVFSGPWSEPDSVEVQFRQDVIFNSSVFKGQARFRCAVFEGAAGFDGCTFGGVVTFKSTVFCGDAKFRTVVVEGYCLLSSAVFKSSARFSNSHFVKSANFESVRFMGAVEFVGVYSSNRAVPVYNGVLFARRRRGEDESFWRFVKQSAQEAGYYHLAGECFYHERCAGLWQKFWGQGFGGLKPLQKVSRLAGGVRLLPELIFGKFLFGYGERPARVLAAGALVIVVCACFYAQGGALIYRSGYVEPSFFQGLYFSTITFTTLGYGDLYPSPEGYIRLLAMTEALAGGCLMALFVVCLAKRFSRG